MQYKDFQTLTDEQKEYALFERIEDIKLTLDGDMVEIKKHLAKLNGQVGENTAARQQTKGALVIMNVILVPLLIYLLTK